MKYGIIGAGPSGLMMAKFLGNRSQILEKLDHPGGHASSFSEKGYTFDYGPHIMFSKNKKILKFMISSLGENVHRCKRNNKISFKGRLIKYPFENDLKSIPLNDNFECLRDYLFNPYKKKFLKPNNLKQWFLKNFGASLCQKYLFPYNEKIWKTPIENLSMLWADRIPKPPAIDVVKSSLGIETEGYLHQLYYHYPLRGGYQALSEVWAKKTSVLYNFDVKKITKTRDGKFIVTNGKKTLEFDEIISTIPVQELIKLLDTKIPRRVKKTVGNLSVNALLLVSLGIKGKDKNKFSAVYFPESDFAVHRIGFPTTFSPNNAPKEHYSIQAEITCKVGSKLWKKNDESILKEVIDGLLKRQIIKDKRQVKYKRVDRVEYAYVVYDKDYVKNTTIIREWFPRQKIHLVGRFSYFEYVNVDMVIERCLKIAKKITNSDVVLQ